MALNENLVVFLQMFLNNSFCNLLKIMWIVKMIEHFGLSLNLGIFWCGRNETNRATYKCALLKSESILMLQASGQL